MPKHFIKFAVVQLVVIYAIRFMRNSSPTIASWFPAGMGVTTQSNTAGPTTVQ